MIKLQPNTIVRFFEYKREISKRLYETAQGAAQRAKRPRSPFIVYQPQLTSIMSIGHRFTGAGLATLLYAFGIYYAAAEPRHFSRTLANEVAKLPNPIVYAGKFILSAPFFYHTFNGIRHLVWDAGYALTLKATYTGGWIVSGATLIVSLAYSLFK